MCEKVLIDIGFGVNESGAEFGNNVIPGAWVCAASSDVGASCVKFRI